MTGYETFVAFCWMIIVITSLARIHELNDRLQLLKTEVINLKAEVKELNLIVGNKGGK